jgi:hypothetical protein
VTGDVLPRLMVLDDREGLVRSALGTAELRERFRVTVLEQPLNEVDADELARRRIPLALGRRGQPVRSAVPELTFLR